MNVWPASLPQQSTTHSYKRSLADRRLRTPNDSGGFKTRRRLSRVPEPVDVSFVLNEDQKRLLETFVEASLEGGTLPFRFPTQEGAAPFWVVQIGDRMPSWSPLGVEWLVQISLVRIPQ